MAQCYKRLLELSCPNTVLSYKWPGCSAKLIIFFFFLFRQPSFSRMVRPLGRGPICPSLEEVAGHAGHEVLMEVDNNSLLIVGNGFKTSCSALIQSRPPPISTSGKMMREIRKRMGSFQFPFFSNLAT